MSKLNLNVETIKQCRNDAKQIANEVQRYIDKHTTVSVERSLLRLLGTDGVNDFDVPLVNVVVDHVVKHADLSKGICHYMSYAVHETRLSPQEIAQKIASSELSLAIYKENKKSAYISHLTPYINLTLNRIQAMTKKRNEMLKTSITKSTPSKYVIVATGNIYEDIKQAVSAAKKGADIIAVIRSTGQSLLDYVPYGATIEGFGGTYATQENFRLMRQALDEVSIEEKRY
ncbi:MAG: lysine 5,6-aminomutase subunit alpha, partial [Acholeplasmataceae bacterium]|nr:lysine 5,6-aminomutase subunit alpha [Acholeplasmataceae bacterium]